MNEMINNESLQSEEKALNALLNMDIGEADDPQDDAGQDDGTTQDVGDEDGQEDVTDEEDGSSDSDEGDADSDFQDDPEEQLHTVKIDGKVESVNLRELKNGYMRQSDYSRKTAEVAEMRRALETRRNTLDTSMQEFQKLGELTASLEEMLKAQEVDLDKVKEEYGFEAWMEAKDALEKKQKQLDKTKAEAASAWQKLEAERNERLKEFLEVQNGLVYEGIPEWKKNSELEKKEKSELSRYLSSQKFEKNEINSLIDARALLLAYKAMKYDNLQNSKPELRKKLHQAGKFIKPGNKATNKSSKTEIYKLAEKAKKTGSEEDVMALLMARGG